MGKYKVKLERDRIAEARSRHHGFYNGQKVDRMPFVYTASGNPGLHSIGDRARDADKNIAHVIHMINYQTENFPDTDFVPFLNLFYLGEGAVASMFGAKQYIVEDNPPYTEGRVMQTIEELHKLPRTINPDEDGWGPILKDHIMKFMDATNGEVPVSVSDHQSPYGTATKIINNEELMIAMYEEPEAVHEFFDIVTTGIEASIDAITRWVGAENVVYNVSVPASGCGLIIWDDYISVVTPGLHQEFCRPYNIRLFERYGYGHLHTCGPYFPGYIDACLACKPISMDCTIMRGMARSRKDMLLFREMTREAGVILCGNPYTTNEHVFNHNNDETDEEFLTEMARGGLIHTESGPKEDGAAATKRWERINKAVYN